MRTRTALASALTARRTMRILPFLAAASLLPSATASAQSEAGPQDGRVEILNADVWEFDKLKNGAQLLKGNVRFKHAGAIMLCDSAHLYEDQRVDAFGHVSIHQGDTLHANAERLHYDAKHRMARLEGNVRLRDRDMDLSTPALDYDLRNRRAVYTQGGTITSRSENNVLTSGAGTYLADQRRFVFSRNVRLDHPQHTIVSDTMHYATSTGVSEFFGPTTITQGGTVIKTLRGEYDTRTERARFTRRSSVQSKGRLLEGDSLHYDRRLGLGEAWGHVVVTDSGGDMRALGYVGRYDEIKESSMITGHAELQMRMGADTLFLHGDTLFTVPTVRDTTWGNGPGGKPVYSLGESRGRTITARRGVRFFKNDLQGACDTLVYADTDSMIIMRHHPVLWNGADQITGDTIRIALRDGQAHRLFVEKNAFLLSQADSAHLDQVTGSMMTGYFAENELRSLDVEGNARTVYFAREDKDGEERLIGVNRADCSRIRVTMKDGKVGTVTFLDRPDAVLYPLEKAPPEELRMTGAVYRGEERPTDREGIFRD
ncbi:MAG: hypothetical protein IPL52_10040 [Flavobacteriales bacterium]|nr:hypothetical protein [Flavobacteriales bacterium]